MNAAAAPAIPSIRIQDPNNGAIAIVGMTELLATAQVRWNSMDTSPLSAMAKAMLAAGIFLSA